MPYQMGVAICIFNSKMRKVKYDVLEEIIALQLGLQVLSCVDAVQHRAAKSACQQLQNISGFRIFIYQTISIIKRGCKHFELLVFG